MANATIEMPAAASTAMANGDIAPLPPLPIAGTRIAAAIAIAMIGTASSNTAASRAPREALAMASLPATSCTRAAGAAYGLAGACASAVLYGSIR